MKQRAKERIELHNCPESVTEQLRLAGGSNRFGDPIFRVVWGWNRIVAIHGEWQEFEQFVAKLTDKFTGYTKSRTFTKLKRSVIETRHVPKYLPANCWHLEMWRPPEEYGTPELWGKLGAEVIGLQTIDTSGPFPSRGEYEICYPLTDDGSVRGKPLPLIADVVSEIAQMIIVGRERFSYQQRKSAIEQEAKKKDEGFVRLAEDRLRSGLRPFSGEKFIVVPGQGGPVQ